MIVLDASAALALLLQTDAGAVVLERLAKEDTSVHAPHLIDLEVASALRRYTARKEIGSRRASLVLRDFLDLSIERHGHYAFLKRIWELRANATTYDASYLALAEALRAPLLTCDRRLAATPGHRAQVELA